MSDMEQLVQAFQSELTAVMEAVLQSAVVEVTRLVKHVILVEVQRQRQELDALKMELLRSGVVEEHSSRTPRRTFQEAGPVPSDLLNCCDRRNKQDLAGSWRSKHGLETGSEEKPQELLRCEPEAAEAHRPVVKEEVVSAPCSPFSPSCCDGDDAAGPGLEAAAVEVKREGASACAVRASHPDLGMPLQPCVSLDVTVKEEEEEDLEDMGGAALTFREAEEVEGPLTTPDELRGPPIRSPPLITPSLRTPPLRPPPRTYKDAVTAPPPPPLRSSKEAAPAPRAHRSARSRPVGPPRASGPDHMRTPDPVAPGRAPRQLLCCGLCGRGFPHPSNLRAHVQTHTGERPFSCPLCGRTFSKLSNLKAHRRVHTGERPYSCSACGKTFTQKCNLKRHQRVHLEEEEGLG